MFKELNQSVRRETVTMATGGGTISDMMSEREDRMTCKICLDIFRAPKLLPCSHTFCKGCLDEVIKRHVGGSFPCPTCREKIRVPPGGASALKNNNYLDSLELEKARDGSYCRDSHKKPLLYCRECEMAICLICKATDHEDHKTEDLRKVADRAAGQLKKDKTRLEHAQTELRQRVEAISREQQALKDKKAAVELAIHDRYATLVAAASRIRDQELTSLQELNAGLENGLTNDLDRLLENLDEVNKLDQRLEQALNGRTGCELLTLAKEMKNGKGSPKSVDKLVSQKMNENFRPFLRFSVTDDVIADYLRRFLGSVDKMWMDIAAPEVTMVERFRCGKETDIEVFSLCPLDDGNVYVSYTRHSVKGDTISEKIVEKENRIVSEKEDAGKQPETTINSKKSAFIPPGTETFTTYDKSQKKTNFKLLNNFSGKADIRREKVISEDPYKAEDVTEFTIKVGAHRAFDVDSSQQLFVVVEEPQPPAEQRKVKIFRRAKQDAVGTYRPPVSDYQPSDVCFYKLGGQEVLLVSDEKNDCIHVVNVQDKAVKFLRYLAPGCPLLVQPTALNMDTKGRLWVACKGGNIITVTPVT